MPGPSFEDVIGLRSAGSPAVPREGRQVVFSLRTTDCKENRYDTVLWRARPGEESFQITRTADGSSGFPAGSPDGRRVAFLAGHEDRRQISSCALLGEKLCHRRALSKGSLHFRGSRTGAPSP